MNVSPVEDGYRIANEKTERNFRKNFQYDPSFSGKTYLLMKKLEHVFVRSFLIENRSPAQYIVLISSDHILVYQKKQKKCFNQTKFKTFTEILTNLIRNMRILKNFSGEACKHDCNFLGLDRSKKK